MQIISHRGLWKDSSDKNKLQSLKKSFDFGFGVETDIRDFNGELVICHDIPDGYKKEIIRVEELFKIYKSNHNKFSLALNIKSDGLQENLSTLLKQYDIKNYFFFDMSIPDSINYIKKDLNVFLRQSEFEKEVPFYNDIKGIWLDCFESIWYDRELIEKHLVNGKIICLVSEELHGRLHQPLWEKIKSWKFNLNDNIILCTDYPELANKFFENGKK
tara:strand:- start:197 stop:844 length:648 start_codon:yes stop_codon:yes gene_type:complete